MKKFILMLFAISTIFVSCQNPASSNDDEITSNTDYDKILITYKSILGNYTLAEQNSPTEPLDINSISFALDSIAINGTSYSFEPETELLVQVFNSSNSNLDKIFWINIDNSYLYITKNYHNYDLRIWKFDSQGNDENIAYYNRSTGGNGGSGSSIELSGTYTIGQTCTKGNVVFNNGNWSLTSGSETGTYSISNNTLTINYSKSGYDFSASWSISKTGSIVTLSNPSGDDSAIAGGLGITDTNVLSNGANITLTTN